MQIKKIIVEVEGWATGDMSPFNRPPLSNLIGISDYRIEIRQGGRIIGGWSPCTSQTIDHRSDDQLPGVYGSSGSAPSAP